MAINARANYRKDTREHRLNTNTDGRNGVFSYAGGFTRHGLGIHIVAVKERDRPATVQLNRADALELKRLIDAYLEIAD